MDERKVLTTEQIHLLACPEISYELCCRTLARLTKQKRIKRARFSLTQPYFYWSDKRPKASRVEHTIGVNWIYTFLRLMKVKVQTFQTEPRDYEPIVEPDAFAILEYTLKKQYYFGEFHRDESGNLFDKIPKYDALYKKLFDERKQGRKSYWWIDLYQEQSFGVIIVTTGKKENIEKHIRNEKAFGWKTEIFTLTELIEKCYRNAESIKKERSVTNG